MKATDTDERIAWGALAITLTFLALVLATTGCATLEKKMSGEKIQKYCAVGKFQFMCFERTPEGTKAYAREFKAADFVGWHLIPGPDFDRAF